MLLVKSEFHRRDIKVINFTIEMHKYQLSKRKIAIDSDVRVIKLVPRFPKYQNKMNVKISEAMCCLNLLVS